MHPNPTADTSMFLSLRVFISSLPYPLCMHSDCSFGFYWLDNDKAFAERQDLKILPQFCCVFTLVAALSLSCSCLSMPDLSVTGKMAPSANFGDTRFIGT